MDTQKFLNRYISSLGEQVKALTMEKTMLVTQLAIAQEEIAELKKQITQDQTSQQTEDKGEWQS